MARQRFRRHTIALPYLVDKDWNDVREGLHRYLRYLGEATGEDALPPGANTDEPTQLRIAGSGDPGDPTLGWSIGPHRHDLLTSAPVGLGNANVAGGSQAVADAEHVHKRDVRVKHNGSDVATRNALDLKDDTLVAWTVADDSGNDEVDVTPAPTPALVAAASWTRHFLHW